MYAHTHSPTNQVNPQQSEQSFGKAVDILLQKQMENHNFNNLYKTKTGGQKTEVWDTKCWKKKKSGKDEQTEKQKQ